MPSSSPYALILSAIMALKKGVLFSVVLFSALLGIGESAGGGWFSWPSSDAVVDSSTSSGKLTPPTPYKYPTPSFIEDNVTALASSLSNNTIIEWIKEHPWIYGVIGGGALIIGALIVAVITICCFFCCRRRRNRVYHPAGGGSPEEGRQKSGKGQPKSGGGGRGRDQPNAEQRRKAREQEEKKTAVEAVKGFLVANPTEYLTQPDDAGNLPRDFILPDMGSRMQKYWFMVEPVLTSQQQYTQLVVTAAPVSQKCPLRLDENMLRGMNKLIGALKPHPYLHKILKIDYRYDSKQVVIVQPYMTSGSLKDMIYKVSPTTDWSRKYSRRSKGLKVDKIQRYGRQILEAVLFLYSKDFPMLGHVQSGNIFVDDDDVCRLGGFENTLLGYKTRLYRLCRNHLQHFDVIMFGHLVFEMSCGYELTHLRPELDDYGNVKEPDVKEVLQYIFKEEFPYTIEQIRDHHFFSVDLPGFDSSTIEFSDHMKKVIKKVRKAKPRDQPSEPATPGIVDKLKHNIQVITRTDKKETEGAGATGGGTEVTVHHGSAPTYERKGTFSFKPWKKSDKEEAPEKEKLLDESGAPAEPKES